MTSYDDLDFLKDPFALIPPHVIEQVKRAMERARSDGYAKGFSDAKSTCDHEGLCDACIDKYEGQAFADCREKAAKIALHFQGNWTSPQYDWYATKSKIGEQIRALERDK